MPKYIDLTGKKINHWNVIKQVGKNKSGVILYLCECDCEKRTQKVVSRLSLNSGSSKSCGCTKKELNLIGQTFNRWTVIGKADSVKGKTFWLCKCSCEKQTVKPVGHTNLVKNKSKSCGCIWAEKNTKHGMSHDNLYHAHDHMLQRCSNPNNPSYEHYGGRGITVCDEWQGENGFINFRDWCIANNYQEGLSLDRKDVNGNYEPNNCRWVTMKVQQNNRRNNNYININGITKTITEWSEDHGISHQVVRNRIKSGWDQKDWFVQPNELDKSSSGIEGISWHKKSNKWMLRVRKNGERKFLGYYTTVEEAKTAKEMYIKSKLNT